MQITNGGFSDFMDLKKWASSASIKNLGLELDVKPTYLKIFQSVFKRF
jgi:hypothetical protein